MSDKIINLVNEIVNTATQRGIAKISIENETYDGKKIIVDGKDLLSFGSYSYLGLEIDKRLKQAAADAISKFGIQYPTSRIYSSIGPYKELISGLEKMFEAPVVLTTSLSLGHSGVLPTIVQKGDVLILDQHVHSSVQSAAQLLKARDIKLDLVRHNDMESLEKKIKSYQGKYSRIWYAIDGIYSMYGDVAPIKEIEWLLNKYSNFYLYADDAHGVSSYGVYGAGWILSKIPFHKKMILSTGMAKAFGTMGGVFAIKDPILYELVNNCTGSMIFSGPHPVPIIGASIASLKIHLSDEIIVRQQFLQEKINYCNKRLKEFGIPEISDAETPIFFVPLSVLGAGYSLVKRLIDDHVYVNLASFPAVSESCTGIRFAITLHHTLDDIDKLILSIAKNLPLALAEFSLSMADVRRAFRKVENFPKFKSIEKAGTFSKFRTIRYNEIIEVPTEIQKNFYECTGLDSQIIKSIQDSFQNNDVLHENCELFFITVLDEKENVVISALFSISVVKDDMLSSIEASISIEEKRKTDELLLSSKILMLGTLITEGSHMYVDYKNNSWKEAVGALIRQLEVIRDENDLNTIFLRDFVQNDHQLLEVLKDNSFLKVDLPDTHIVYNMSWETELEFLSSLSKRHRYYLRNKVLKKESEFDVRINEILNEELLESMYEMYKNVNERSHDLNTFTVPKKWFLSLVNSENWEVISLRHNLNEHKSAMMLCRKADGVYNPIFIGMNYNDLEKDIYPQILWQTIKRAKSLNSSKVTLGFTASQNKRKFGAKVQKKYAVVKSKDDFMLSSMSLEYNL
ncbi:MAG: aminotransferase class I/II-fold pyridoxal phosphate-dependent enzyme [Crocinitomicaceae bacterium]|nr:aminotransferase class I/II-fold pyridoxal phosphate-dependent enzyme [Crocinitomicaceae bacterium]